MNYNKKTKVELIKLLKSIDSSVLRALEFCDSKERSHAERLGYALGTLKRLNKNLNEDLD